MSLGESIRKNSLWVLYGSLGGRMLDFAFGIVLARLLVPEDFGMLVTAQIFTGFLSYVANGGLGEAMVQAKQLRPRDPYVIFTTQMVIGILIYIGLFLFAPTFAEWFNEDIYTDLLRISAITFLLRPFANTPVSLMRRDMRFKPISIINFVGLLVASTVSIVCAWLGYGVWSLIIAGLVRPLITIPGYWWAARWLPVFTFDREVLQRLGGFGFRVFVNEIIVYVRTQTSNLLISHQLGPMRVGIFNKADSLSEIPTLLISGSAYQTVFRALSSLQDNRDKSHYIFLRSITLVCLYALPMYVGLLWLGEAFIVTLYGEQWRAAGLLLQILAITGLFRIIANLSGAVAAARNRLGSEIRIQLESWAILLAGALFGLQWGFVGVAIGLIPNFIYSCVRLYGLASGILGIGWRELWVALRPVLKMNAVMFIVLAVTDRILAIAPFESGDAIYLMIMMVAGGAVYGALLLFRPDEQLRTESERWNIKLNKVLAPFKLGRAGR